ncbi:DUF2294 family protein [Bacillus sp. BGMRC 2118]|nr:DUF2294 family protein [Bacillus sp. BGMRC 2118]
MENLEEKQEKISTYINQLLQDSFGKNPDWVSVTFNGTFITIYIRGFLSPPEKVLLEQDKEMLVYQMREKLMISFLPEIKTYIQVITGAKIREMYYDWNFQNKSGMIAGVSSEPFTSMDELKELYTGKQEIEQEVITISQQTEKVPEEIYSCLVSPRVLIVIRNGILVRIEKEFIRLGYQDTLKSVKRNLEKSYLHNSSHMESYLNQQIVDVFVDWDLQLDKSLIVLMLNPKEPMGQEDVYKVNIE